ncbi:putative protein isoform X2 [Capsicum annuum]|uniref:uncharacterized protein LOC107873311 isoform X2 n=1 Tax=Capsicum annuum TaxID=4072 RepID=UPI001FB12409|nr:uncharacterized protein LOC107873311 isoform X2 [Capsicum annuum]
MNSAAAMFAKFFGKFNPTPPNNALQGSEKLTDLEATVSVHYGIPSTVSILAFDPFQQLLAIGTLDGRIKVIRGSNVEGLLFSPKPLPFKNLEFLQNQGFLVGVSNVNEIQIWDLENRRISSNLQWESNITAFSVIYDTHHMFVGDEYGYLSVLKYEGREGSIELLPYHIPPNLIAGVDFIGKLLRFQCPTNLPLLVYFPNLVHMETEVRAALVREFKQLQSKDEIVVYASKSSSEERFRASSDNQEGEKEISSLCWLSYDGSILAVGYVDGDILLWNLSVLGKKSSEAEASSSYVKLQLSAGGRRLPAIILRWCANNAQNGCGGQLFVYGGDSIGSDEALTVLRHSLGLQILSRVYRQGCLRVQLVSLLCFGRPSHLVEFCPRDTGFQFSVIKSPVCILKFVAVGARLVAGFESGQVAMLDVSSASVLFITDCLSSSSSRITSVAVKTLGDALEDTMEHCEEGRTNPYVKEVISVLTRDADVVLLDGSTGRKISFQAKHPKEMSTAISLCILDGITSVSEESQKHSSMLDSAVQPEDLMQKGCMDSQILLCCQDGLHLFSLGSIIQAPFFYLSLLQHFLLFSYIRQFVIDYVIIGRYQPCT